MSIQKRPGTLKESTEAINSVSAHSTASLVNDTMVPAVNQLISEEVSIFLDTVDQSLCSPADVETLLLNRINTRLISENTKYGLKGVRAYRLLQVLPPFVIARCIFHRELPHTGLIGRLRRTAELMTYQATGVNKGLYVFAEDPIYLLASAYNQAISDKDLQVVVRCVRNLVQMLTENKDSHIAVVANGLFDPRSKKLLPFSPDVVLRAKASVAFPEEVPTCPVINGWSVDEWIRELADNDPDVEHLFWQVIAALFRPDHAFNKAILLYSPTGSNGKGTFLELLRNLVGVDRVASLSMSDFGDSYFPPSLSDCFAVLSDENEVGNFMRKAGGIKAWVTHDWFRVNEKYGQMRYVKGRGLCVFCVNELPVFKDKSESLYRRFVVIPFVKRFVGEDENPAIKNDYLKRREVLEYVAYKALMMDPFDTFIEPDVCKDLLGQMRAEGDSVLQFAEEFLDRFVWDLLPWEFTYGVYRAWMNKDVPSGRPVSRMEFTKRMSEYVDKNPSCGWFVPRGKDGKQKKVSTRNRIVGNEPLAVEYDITNWFDMQPVNGSIRKIGIPHNIPINARGLMRTTAIADDDELDRAVAQAVGDSESTPEEHDPQPRDLA